jgi:hypothetical protein
MQDPGLLARPASRKRRQWMLKRVQHDGKGTARLCRLAIRPQSL